MGYHGTSVIVHGVVLCSNFQKKKDLLDVLDPILEKLLPGNKIIEYQQVRSFEIKNGYKTYQFLRLDHGEQESAVVIALHVERSTMVRCTTEWPKKLSRPSEHQIKEFVEFLGSKGINNEYGEYQCFEGGC